MNFTKYSEAAQVAKEADKKLTAYDFHYHEMVLIQHEDGAILTWRSAFLREWKDYVFVFTEHHGYHVYHKSDLEEWRQFQVVDSKKLVDTGYRDNCEFCGKEFKVEDLRYDILPFGESLNDYHVYCDNCLEAKLAEDDRDDGVD